MRYERKAKYALIIFLSVFFEMLFCKYLEISGAIPMLTFCIIMIISAFEKKEGNVIFSAIFAGAVLDIFSGHGFGTYTVIFFICAAISFFFSEKIFSSKLLFLMVSTFLLTLFAQTGYYLLHIGDISGNFGTFFTSKIMGTALYNMIIAVIFYPACVKIYKTRRK